MLWLTWLPLATCTAWTLSGLSAVARVTRRHQPLDARPPGVSVLKPLCGSDPDLRTNLESFFRQDHPALELLFGVTDPADPAIAVVHELAAAYPEVACQVIVHPGEGALNPKIDNLLGMLPHAKHDLVLVSDSNVRAPRHYVRELATIQAREQPGLVTNLFVGVGEDSLGAALESVQLAGFCAAGSALPTALGDAVLVGKSVLCSRQRLERLGGLHRLSNVLAEDFVMGKTFVHAGDRVVIAPTVLETTTRGISVRGTLARHLRWSMMRFRLRPVLVAFEPVLSPLALLPLAWLVLGPWALLWAALVMVVRDLGGWLVLRGPRRWYLPILLAPLRELLLLGVWLVAPHKKHVSWRGKRFRLGAGTLLYRDQARISRASIA
jgi:ceramide glucosyltransferase